MKAENLPFADGEFDARDRDRGARARARPRAHGRRDGARGPALAARLGAARAALARAQRGARRLHEGPRQHPRARQPLVQARVRRAAVAATARSSRRARRSRGRCCSSGRLTCDAPRLRVVRPRRPHPLDRHRLDRAWSRSPTSPSRPTCSTTSPTSSISLLWSVLFVIVSVIYRPIEQLLSRTIADRRARGFEHGHPLRHAAADPGRVRARLPRRRAGAARADPGRPVRRLDARCTGSSSSPCSPTRRATSRAAGWPGTSGSRSTAGSCSSRRARGCRSRSRSPSGIAHGRDRGRARHGGGAVRLARRGAAGRSRAGRRREGEQRVDEEALGPRARRSLRARGVRGDAGRADAAQRRRADSSTRPRQDAAVAGFVFNVLLIARAPLQLFQAIQGSLLPHLAGLEAREGRAEFARAIRVTVLAIAGFAGAVALGLLIVGPFAMDVLFDDALHLRALGARARGARHGLPPRPPARSTRRRWPATARARRRRAGCSARSRSSVWMVSAGRRDELLRAEVGYFGAAVLLCALLAVVYRATSSSPGPRTSGPS